MLNSCLNLLLKAGRWPIYLVFLASCCTITSACAPQRMPDADSEIRALSLIDQGVAALRQADLDRAEAAFSVAAELNGSSAAYDGLGCVFFLRKQFGQAEKFFRHAIDLDQQNSEALANLALLKEIQGLKAEAQKLYQLAIEADPKNFRARNNFAGLISDYYPETVAKTPALAQLSRAEVLVEHPLLDKNLNKMGVK